MGGFGDWGLKGGTGRALGAWVSFWVWWGFKQASIYLGLGVALIDGRVLGQGPSSTTSTASKQFTPSPLAPNPPLAGFSR